MSESELTPQDHQEINQEIAQEQADQTRETLLEISRKGISLLDPGKPLERLQAYLSNTHAADMTKVLAEDPTYADQIRAGTAEPLYSEQLEAAWAEQLMMRQRALEAGVDPNLPVFQEEEPPMLFWAKLLRLPFGVDLFEQWARDFNSVWNNQRARERKREQTTL